MLWGSTFNLIGVLILFRCGMPFRVPTSREVAEGVGPRESYSGVIPRLAKGDGGAEE